MKCETLLPDIEAERDATDLDLVVPFTTPELTRAAIRAAEQLGTGLAASIRLIQPQLVPYQVEMCPINVEFLQDQLAKYTSTLPIQATLLLTREADADLLAALRPESIVVIATPKRLWPTKNTRLARKFREAGHRVVLVTATEEHNHA